MGFLVIISETGFPHSACLFITNGRQQWRGFKPRIPKVPYGPGYVDTSDRTKYIKNFVKFKINDSVLENALQKVTISYETRFYKVVLGPDCVNLSVDAASWCGLKTPPPPNLLPDILIEDLKILNPSWLQN